MRRVLLVVAILCFSTMLDAQSGAKNGEWRSYAADTGSTRYSPLDQINASNFNKLEVAWRFKTDNLGPRPANSCGCTASRKALAAARLRGSCRAAASPTGPTAAMNGFSTSRPAIG